MRTIEKRQEMKPIEMKLARRLGGVGEYYFSKKLREIDRMRASGRQIINLGIGSPDRPPHPDVIGTLAAEAAKPGNHGYQPYKGAAVLREAFYIVQQGIADAATVDDVMKYSLGRRWNLVGPLASIDLGGLDVFYNISTYLFDDMDNGTGPSPLLAEKVREGNLGAKTGQGFFSWQGEDGKRIIESRNKALLRALKDDAADAAAAQA